MDRWTDRRTDDVQSQDRTLHYSASRGKNQYNKWDGVIFIEYQSGHEVENHRKFAYSLQIIFNIITEYRKVGVAKS